MNRNLNLLLGGQLVSQIGDKLHLLAVAFLVLETTGSPARMGLVLFCSVFPAMLLGMVAGAVLDRKNKKHVIVAADLVRGLVVAALGLAYLRGALSFGLLLTAQVLISICSAFFDPAVPAMIPQMVDRQNLNRANAQTQMVSGIATIAGPTLGGLTVAWGGYLPIFAINAASYLFSAAAESMIHLRPRRQTDRAKAKTGLAGDILAGWRYVWQRQQLVVILAMVAVIHGFVGAIEAVIPVMAAGLPGKGAANMGFIQTALGTGTVVAALLISIRQGSGRQVQTLFGGVAAIGLLMVMIAALRLGGATSLGLLLPFFLLLGGALILAGTSFRSLVQAAVREEMMGRVFGFVSSVGNISIPMAALAAGFALEFCRPAHLLMGCGLILPLLGAGGYRLYGASARQAWRASCRQRTWGQRS